MHALLLSLAVCTSPCGPPAGAGFDEYALVARDVDVVFEGGTATLTIRDRLVRLDDGTPRAAGDARTAAGAVADAATEGDPGDAARDDDTDAALPTAGEDARLRTAALVPAAARAGAAHVRLPT
jgi:hypothetical protein